ncbi:MAG: serine/threonine protein kinase [Pirellulales bacterium]|nr:serine/threonine protein kinase [Pirellulales bacterium]
MLRKIAQFVRRLGPAGHEFVGGDSGDLSFLSPVADGEGLGNIDGYRALSVLGAGGMGTVLLAVDTETQERVALKVLHPHLAASKNARRRFIREGTIAMSIHDDNVLGVYFLGSDHDPHYIATEYMSGGSLQDCLDRDGPLEAARVRELGVQVARGLAAVHAMGLVHSDLKPSNILLDEARATVKISDFGLARVIDAKGSAKQRSVFATPAFASPEQVRGQRIDARSDLFSLGSVLYAMCTARPPFPGESSVTVTRELCNRSPRPLEELNPSTPSWLVAIINKLMKKSPASRYQTAEEVAAALADAVGDPASSA